jgi:hypothetical protein
MFMAKARVVMLSDVFTPLSKGFCQEKSKTPLLAFAAEDSLEALKALCSDGWIYLPEQIFKDLPFFAVQW